MTRVWIDGCFDLAHYGHANSLRQAAEHGDVLVVGVHSDEDITTNKGEPVTTETPRYRLMKSIRWCDQLIEGSTYFPDESTLFEYQCNFAMHGDDAAITLDGTDSYGGLKEVNKLKFFERT